MSPLIIFNIVFALIFYPMFTIDYYRKESYMLNLFLFLINALVSLYAIFNAFGIWK